MPRASIDLGSHSALLTVLGDDGQVLHDEARVVGLGRGLGDGGALQPDRVQAALGALADYARAADGLGVPPDQVLALATSAARRAQDAPAFFATVRQQTGLGFRVISGAEEASLTWTGAVSGLDLPPTSTALVVDLGGGSTELAVGQAGGSGPGLSWSHSFEVGSVRLTEAVLGHPARVATLADLRALEARVRDAFRALPLPCPVDEVIGVAGSVTTLAAAAMGLAVWDSARVHGALLTDADLARFQTALVGAGPEVRRALFAVSPERADVLLAAATVLREVLSLAGAERMRVSDRGLRYGALLAP